MSSSGPETQVRVGVEGGVGHIVLDRPDKLNAMTGDTVRQLHAALDVVAGGGARVLLISAAGRAFSAGRDLADARPGEEDGGQVLAKVYNPLIQRITDLPVPTVAAVQGACLGTGLGVALACDVILAANSAKFGSPFAAIGAVLDSGAHRAFVQRLGPAVTLDLIYSGRFLSGTEAAAAGLVSRVVPAADLSATALDYAARIAAGPALALAESRAIVRRLCDAPATVADGLTLEAAAQGRASQTADYVEGFTAFLQRRAPRFTGR